MRHRRSSEECWWGSWVRKCRTLMIPSRRGRELVKKENSLPRPDDGPLQISNYDWSLKSKILITILRSYMWGRYRGGNKLQRWAPFPILLNLPGVYQNATQLSQCPQCPETSPRPPLSTATSYITVSSPFSFLDERYHLVILYLLAIFSFFPRD